MVLNLHPQAIPQLIFPLHHLQRQCRSNPAKDKQCPLPPEWIDQDAKHKPICQLGVCEEIECSGRRVRFQRPSHVDPSLHPELIRSG